MEFHIKLKNYREDKDLTQKLVADLIPMNQSNYSKIESGTQEPNLQQLTRIAEILEVSIDDLLDNEAFSGCKSLQDITLPDSVERIGDYAFEGCNLLAPNKPEEYLSSLWSNWQEIPSLERTLYEHFYFGYNSNNEEDKK